MFLKYYEKTNCLKKICDYFKNLEIASEIAVSFEVGISQSHYVSLKYNHAAAVMKQFVFLDE